MNHVLNKSVVFCVIEQKHKTDNRSLIKEAFVDNSAFAALHLVQ